MTSLQANYIQLVLLNWIFKYKFIGKQFTRQLLLLLKLFIGFSEAHEIFWCWDNSGKSSWTWYCRLFIDLSVCWCLIDIEYSWWIQSCNLRNVIVGWESKYVGIEQSSGTLLWTLVAMSLYSLDVFKRSMPISADTRP